MINQVITEEQVIEKENNITVDTFMVIPTRKESEDLIDKVANLTINAVNENDLIDEVMNLTIKVRNNNNLVNKVANVTVNDAGNHLNQVNAGDVKF